MFDRPTGLSFREHLPRIQRERERDRERERGRGPLRASWLQFRDARFDVTRDPDVLPAYREIASLAGTSAPSRSCRLLYLTVVSLDYRARNARLRIPDGEISRNFAVKKLGLYNSNGVAGSPRI